MVILSDVSGQPNESKDPLSVAFATDLNNFLLQNARN
jgi:hypothetical protein